MMSFDQEVKERISAMGGNEDLQRCAAEFMRHSIAAKYSYNFSWLGRPIIQYPQDMAAMQEIIWQVKPDLIIETGIAHGGSLVFSASMLALLDLCDAEAGAAVVGRRRKVLGIDIDIRPHNRAAIEAHPLSGRIEMIEGSSIDPEIIARVCGIARDYGTVLVCLDSNHTHDHVLAELEAYAPLTSIGSYCVVFDTIVEDLPKELAFGRPWSPGNNPKTAVHEFLNSHGEFEIDKRVDWKLMIGVAPDGYLKRVG